MGNKTSQSRQVTTLRDSEVDYDIPLQSDSALQRDKLSRKGYAEIAAAALRKVPSSAGLVVSIEGAWGSGKTSALAMIEALLLENEESTAPLIVHFNPWLVGGKDALLRNFLSRIASVVKLNDHSNNGKKVASEIKAYAKVLDLVKLIPGTEPWATLIKSIIETAGEVTASISEYKTPDIEVYKLRVEQALQNFDRPIIVLIDDIDRLFPLEVFEMIRIIKAVGGLPRLGYVVAWDSMYVAEALEKLGVPQASSYLDKIVQVRMPLPSLSMVARRKLIEEALDKLDPEALRQRFRNQDDRLGTLYHSGLRYLLEQPRDIVRVFNALRMMEPLLRDEIVFADILGLAALSVKAPAVFDLLRKKPHIFVGQQHRDFSIMKKQEEVIKEGEDERRIAFEATGAASAAKRVVHFLFPRVARADDSFSLGNGTYVEGNISHPAKLAIALQLSVSDEDVSIKAARQYLQIPIQREPVVAGLTNENCDDFIILLGEVSESLQGEGITDLSELCVSIVRLIDEPLFIARSTSNIGLFKTQLEDMALHAVSLIIRATDKESIKKISKLIATDSIALTCAAKIVAQSNEKDQSNYSNNLTLSAEDTVQVFQKFSVNVLNAAKLGTLLKMNQARSILWTMANVVPQDCPSLLQILKESDPTLDQFALIYFGGYWNSTKGNSYRLEASLQEIYLPLADLKAHAALRLQDESLQYPERAVWRSIFEGSHLYGADGSKVPH